MAVMIICTDPTGSRCKNRRNINIYIAISANHVPSSVVGRRGNEGEMVRVAKGSHVRSVMRATKIIGCSTAGDGWALGTKTL